MKQYEEWLTRQGGWGQKYEHWYRALVVVGCSECGAKPEENCKMQSGEMGGIHQLRCDAFGQELAKATHYWDVSPQTAKALYWGKLGGPEPRPWPFGVGVGYSVYMGRVESCSTTRPGQVFNIFYGSGLEGCVRVGRYGSPGERLHRSEFGIKCLGEAIFQSGYHV